MARVRGLTSNAKGAAVAEYGLIAAIVGAAIAVASLALGSAVTNAVQQPACASGVARC